MQKKLRIAVIGCGAFAKRFINLFKYHPNTEKVFVCDLIKEKAESFSKQFGVEIIDSFESALADKTINCIANFTQRHLHGDITIRALKAGKSVYSAVPMASHQFLIDDFCKAAVTGENPALNAWFAARCNILGLIAIESAKQGGMPLPVPDMGDAPKV